MQCTAIPRIASVSEAPRAYLQRAVALVIAIACLVFSFDTLYADCRMFKIYKQGKNKSGNTDVNFTDTVDVIINAIGEDSVVNFRIDEVDPEIWAESEAVFIGVTSYAFVDYEDHGWLGMQTYNCIPFEFFENDQMSSSELYYYNAIRSLQKTVPYVGIAGLLLSSVELFCFNWYPTVLLGGLLLGVAGFCELCFMGMYAADISACFGTQQCHVHMNFWGAIFVAGGFIFSSILVLMGLRTYPFFRRRRRDPRYCQSIEPEVITVAEIRPDIKVPERPSAGRNSAGGTENVNWPAYVGMESRLVEVRQLLERSLEETRHAVERAHRAEAKLRAMAIEMKERVSMRSIAQLGKIPSIQEAASRAPTQPSRESAPRAMSIDMNGKVTSISSHNSRDGKIVV